MTRDEIIDRLRAAEPALKAKGAMHAALFGSRARGDARSDSDTDVMVEIDPAAPVTIYDLVALREYVASLIDGKVDVVERDGLKRSAALSAQRDAVYAF